MKILQKKFDNLLDEDIGDKNLTRRITTAVAGATGAPLVAKQRTFSRDFKIFLNCLILDAWIV